MKTGLTVLLGVVAILSMFSKAAPANALFPVAVDCDVQSQNKESGHIVINSDKPVSHLDIEGAGLRIQAALYEGFVDLAVIDLQTNNQKYKVDASQTAPDIRLFDNEHVVGVYCTTHPNP